MKYQAFGEGTIIFTDNLSRTDRKRVRDLLVDKLTEVRFKSPNELHMELYRDTPYDEKGILAALNEVSGIVFVKSGDLQLTDTNDNIWRFHFKDDIFFKQTAVLTFTDTKVPTKARDFMSLTDDEIKQILTDIFEADKVTCIRHHKRDDVITAKVYIEWFYMDDNGKELSRLEADEVEMRNPFLYGRNALVCDCLVNADDYMKWKQFCFAKGIFPPYMENNPYL